MGAGREAVEEANVFVMATSHGPGDSESRAKASNKKELKKARKKRHEIRANADRADDEQQVDDHGAEKTKRSQGRDDHGAEKTKRSQGKNPDQGGSTQTLETLDGIGAERIPDRDSDKAGTTQKIEALDGNGAERIRQKDSDMAGKAKASKNQDEDGAERNPGK